MATITADALLIVRPVPVSISPERQAAVPQPVYTSSGIASEVNHVGDGLLELNRYIYFPDKETFPNAISGTLGDNFVNIYYEKIHVNPPSFDAGNVSTTISYDVEVWNSFFTPKLLTELVALNAEGINVLNGILEGGTYGALENSIYNVEVTPEGPANIDADLRWTFSTDFGSHNIIGNRLVLFPFRPAGPITETLQWMTNVLRSHSSEQRIALRKHPRQIWGMRYKQKDSVQARINSAMWGRNIKPFGLPIWTDVSYLYDPITSGTDTIYLDTRYFDYRENGLLVLLYRDDLTNEAKEIAEIYNDRLVLTRPLETNFPDGALAMPVVICMPEGGLVREDIGNGVTVSNIKFRAIENLEYVTSPEATYLGYEILDDYWNIRRGGNVASSILHPSVIIDNQTVETWDVFEYRDKPDELWDWSWVADNPEQRWNNKMLLMRMRGRQKPFWISTRVKDFELADIVASSASEWTVYNMGQNYLELIGDPRHVEILLKDGSIYQMEVVGLTDTSTDKSTQIIEMSDIFGIEVAPEDVERISYLRLVRFNSDEAVITHNLGIYSEVTMPLITVEQPTGL